MPRNRLPKKLSAVILLALEDLAKVERSRTLNVAMDEWIGCDTTGKVCSTCFAGSMMVKRLQLDVPIRSLFHTSYVPTEDLFDQLSEHDKRCMYALNSIRDGSVAFALSEFGVKKSERFKWMDRDDLYYYDDPKVWRKQVESIIRDLKSEGL